MSLSWCVTHARRRWGLIRHYSERVSKAGRLARPCSIPMLLLAGLIFVQPAYSQELQVLDVGQSSDIKVPASKDLHPDRCYVELVPAEISNDSLYSLEVRECDPPKDVGKEDVGRNFANTRANIIVSNGPDLGPIHNRLTNSQTSNQATALSVGNSSQPYALGGPAEKDPASVKTEGAMFLTGSDYKSGTRLPVNVWVQGQPIYFEDNSGGGNRDGHAGLGFLGADVLVGSSVLVGVMAQLDWMDESSPVSGSKIDGDGWMVGPYMSMRLLPQVFLDARAAWGESSNTVDWSSGNRDKFDTDRMLLSARLSATVRKPDMPNLRIAPSVSVSYFDEKQHSYNSAETGFVPEQDVSLGRATFGTEFGYTFDNADGTKIEPLVAIKGIWDFEKEDITIIGGQVVSPNDFRGLVEAGATLTTTNGLSIRATGSYDGIGDDDFEAYKGQFFIIMPFN